MYFGGENPKREMMQNGGENMWTGRPNCAIYCSGLAARNHRIIRAILAPTLGSVSTSEVHTDDILCEAFSAQECIAAAAEVLEAVALQRLHPLQE